MEWRHIVVTSGPSAANFENWDGTPSGGILTTIGPDQTVVRLEGEIDISMSEEFGQLLLSLPTATAELVLDVTGLTFCDCTLASFVVTMLRYMPVTITPRNRWVVDFLQLVHLADQVRIVDAITQPPRPRRPQLVG